MEPIIDSHLHVIERERFSYPWLAADTAMNRPWRLAEYLREAKKSSIVAAIHVEADVPYGDRQGEVGMAAQVHEFVIGQVAAARPEQPEILFNAEIETLIPVGHVRGVRRILHIMPDCSWFTQTFVANLRLLGRHGLTFDLCLRADQLADAIGLVDAAPGTQFILDHCGIPTMGDKDWRSWSIWIAELAKRPNVAAKVSGIVAYGGPHWSIESLRPYVEFIIERFEWNRVLWGSDYPVCTRHARLADWVDATRTIVRHCSARERRKLFVSNALRIYGVPNPKALDR